MGTDARRAGRSKQRAFSALLGRDRQARVRRARRPGNGAGLAVATQTACPAARCCKKGCENGLTGAVFIFRRF